MQTSANAFRLGVHRSRQFWDRFVRVARFDVCSKALDTVTSDEVAIKHTTIPNDQKMRAELKTHLSPDQLKLEDEYQEYHSRTDADSQCSTLERAEYRTTVLDHLTTRCIHVRRKG